MNQYSSLKAYLCFDRTVHTLYSNLDFSVLDVNKEYVKAIQYNYELRKM